MRTDMLLAGILGTLSLFLVLLGYFVLDWSGPLLGLFAAVFVVADGYFLWGIFQMTRESQAK